MLFQDITGSTVVTFQAYDSIHNIFVVRKWETMPFEAEDSSRDGLAMLQSRS